VISERQDPAGAVLTGQRENQELRRANEILRKAFADFAHDSA
jgi:transposase-like protein